MLFGFVEEYFNLSFQEAMQKINEDFNLGLENTTKIDYRKINQIKLEKERKRLQKEKLNKEFVHYSKLKLYYQKIIKQIESLINFSNLDNMMELKLEFRDEIINIEDKIDKIEKEVGLI